jgi:hypothetical protein
MHSAQTEADRGEDLEAMAGSGRRVFKYLAWLLASAAVIVAGCFTINCLIDPLWYLRGNVLTHINHAFDERLAKVSRFFGRDPQQYDCLILGTSRATLIPERAIPGHRCFNFAFSDAQASELVLYAKYLKARGVAPKLLIVDVKREEFIGPTHEPNVPDFVKTGGAPPSIFASYLSLDALDFSIRTLRGDAPHHRYYNPDFEAVLEVRSGKHLYNPAFPVEAMAPPNDVHPERAELYIQLRQVFPEAQAIAYLPPESAWRIEAFNMTGELDAYLGAVARIAAAYDEFRDFAIPSPLTESKEATYDGSHYSAEVNARIAATLMSEASELGIDWKDRDLASIIALYHERLGQFVADAKRERVPKG